MDFAREIKARLPATEVLPYYGIEVNRAGFCRCPFHNERTGSMKVYPEEGGFYCFGCHAHGTVIDFVMEYFGISYKEAIAKMNEDFGLGLPIGVKLSNAQRLEEAKKAFYARRQREQEQEERRKFDRKVEAAFDEWHRLDAQIIQYAPKKMGEKLHPLFIEGLKEIASAGFRLDCAEVERIDHERACENTRV